MAGRVGNDGNWIKGIEDYVPKSQFETDEYQNAVVDDILKNWMTLSQGGQFHAILPPAAFRKPSGTTKIPSQSTSAESDRPVRSYH